MAFWAINRIAFKRYLTCVFLSLSTMAIILHFGRLVGMYKKLSFWWRLKPNSNKLIGTNNSNSNLQMNAYRVVFNWTASTPYKSLSFLTTYNRCKVNKVMSQSELKESTWSCHQPRANKRKQVTIFLFV